MKFKKINSIIFPKKAGIFANTQNKIQSLIVSHEEYLL